MSSDVSGRPQLPAIRTGRTQRVVGCAACEPIICRYASSLNECLPGTQKSKSATALRPSPRCARSRHRRLSAGSSASGKVLSVIGSSLVQVEARNSTLARRLDSHLNLHPLHAGYFHTTSAEAINTAQYRDARRRRRPGVSGSDRTRWHVEKAARRPKPARLGPTRYCGYM